MLNDFSTEYAGRGDDELLDLASDQASLTNEATAALNAELNRRNLTPSDLHKYQHSVKRDEQREAKRRLRKVLGTPRDRSSWVDLFWSLLAISLISLAYLALPDRYHLKPDWQEAAVNVMFASIFIAVAFRIWWRKIAFWISLLISSATHLVLVHVWMQRGGNLSRGQGKLAVLLGFVLFFATYGCVELLRRNFYGEGGADEKIA